MAVIEYDANGHNESGKKLRYKDLIADNGESNKPVAA